MKTPAPRPASTVLGIGLILAFFLAGCATGPGPAYTGAGVQEALAGLDYAHRQGTLVIEAPAGSTVTVRQQRHEFWFGAALANGIFDGTAAAEDVARYKEAFLENFNSAVTENALKWLSMQPTADPANYATVDAILDWTDAHEIPLRGHNIFWGVHWWVQPWLKQLDDATLHATLEDRAIDIATRYRGRFAQYDLNNEMIHDNYYADRLGEGITLEMSNWVMGIDPSAKLFLNDYDILTGKKLDTYVEHIRTLLDEGVAVAGIGVQGHLHGETFDPAALRHALDVLAQFDLPIVITEFNFPGQRSRFQRNPKDNPMTPAEEAAKARAITDYYRICFAHPAVEGILMWGFWAGDNWIPASSLYRRDWSPTPALEAYRDLVYGEWWTTAQLPVGSDGRVSLPAFFGRYTVEVGDETRAVELRRAEGSATVRF